MLFITFVPQIFSFVTTLPRGSNIQHTPSNTTPHEVHTHTQYTFIEIKRTNKNTTPPQPMKKGRGTKGEGEGGKHQDTQQPNMVSPNI
jgi:hypothetical protein